MGLSFYETMTGHVVDRWGSEHPIDFEVAAEASHLRQFLRTGEARLTGVVHAPPWVDGVALDGTITLALLRGRSITYDITFTDHDGHNYSFVGIKDLSWLRPIATATRLRGVLERDGVAIARGPMTFDLNGLLSFAASWKPHTTVRALPLRITERSSPNHDARLRALAEAVIPPGEHVPPVDDLTLEHTHTILSRMPGHVRTAHDAAMAWLDVESRRRTGRGFAALPLDRRTRIVEQLAADPGLGPLRALPPRRLLDLAAMPLKGAHFHRRDYLERIGYPELTNDVREPDPPWMAAVTAAEDLDTTTELEADVVVVGSGAGGAALAAELAERGVAVAVVEAGRYLGRRDFTGSPLDRMHRFWQQSGMTFSVGNTAVSIPLGKAVGGTTTINSGTCYRTPDAVLAEWRAEGFPNDFHPEAWHRWSARVEDELGVTPGARPHLGAIADIVAKGAAELGYGHGPLPRNAPGCDGQGVCMLGCPTDAKRSANVSWMPRAIQAGAALFTGVPVTRILRRGRRVIGVEARGTDQHGAPKLLRIRAAAVVLATGTVHTPALLWRNGFDLPMIGQNLSVHPGFGMWVRTDRQLDPWNAIPQSYGVQSPELDADGIRFEGFYLPPEIAAIQAPAVGAELTRWMDAQRQCAQFGFMIRDGGDGHVTLGPDGRPILRYDLSPRSLGRLQRGAAILAEMLLRGGGEELLVGLGPIRTAHTLEQARAIADAPLRPVDFGLLGAHPLGTCRMSGSAATGVVDFDNRVFGTDNLYVVDGAAVPSSLGVNPQVTIMTMALRAAEGLAARLA